MLGPVLAACFSRSVSHTVPALGSLPPSPPGLWLTYFPMVHSGFLFAKANVCACVHRVPLQRPLVSQDTAGQFLTAPGELSGLLSSPAGDVLAAAHRQLAHPLLHLGLRCQVGAPAAVPFVSDKGLVACGSRGCAERRGRNSGEARLGVGSHGLHAPSLSPSQSRSPPCPDSTSLWLPQPELAPGSWIAPVGSC